MKRSGFTLLEIMLVIAAIGILITVVLPTVTQYIERSRNSARVIKTDSVIKTLISRDPEALIGNWTFDDKSPNIAIDTGGRGEALSLVNSPQNNIGHLGNAMSLNGINQYANLSALHTFPFASEDFSISLWVNIDNTIITPGDAKGLLGKSNGAFNVNGIGIELRLRQNGVEFCRADGSIICPRVIIEIPLQGWHHIGITHNHSTGFTTLYIDGSLLGSNTLSNGVYTDSYSLWVGRGTDGYTTGDIDNIFIYAAVLSSGDMRSIYEAGK